MGIRYREWARTSSSPSGSCSSFFSSSAQSTSSLLPEPLLVRLSLVSILGDSGASVSRTEMVGLVGVVVASALVWLWLWRRPNAWRISIESARDDEVLRSPTTMSGCTGETGEVGELQADWSSSGVLPSVSESGTVTMESVGSGALSTWVLGERCTAWSTGSTPVGSAVGGMGVATSVMVRSDGQHRGT